jgi:tetratricopeptide (TPR) repeat protein
MIVLFLTANTILFGCSSIIQKGQYSVEEHGVASPLVYNEFGLVPEVEMGKDLKLLMEQNFDFATYTLLRNSCLESPCKMDTENRKNMVKFLEGFARDFRVQGYLVRDLFFHALKIQNDVDLVGNNGPEIGHRSREILSILHEIRPTDQELLYQYAFSIMKSGDGKDALPIVLKLYEQTKNEKQKINYGLILVNLYEEEERFSDSKRIYSQLLKLDANNSELCYRWVKSTQAIDGVGAALSNFEQCRNAYKNEEGLAQFYFIKGRMHLERNEMYKAKGSFENSFREDQTYGPAILAKAIIAEEMGNHKEAIDFNEKYLSLNPQDSKTIFKLVDLYIEKKLYDKAANILSRLAEKAAPDHAIVKKYILLLYESKNFDEIISFLPDYLNRNASSKIELNDQDQYFAILYAAYQSQQKAYEGISYLKKISPSGNFFQFSIMAQLEILRDQGVELRGRGIAANDVNFQVILKDFESLAKQALQNGAEEFQFFSALALSFRADFLSDWSHSISILRPWFNNELFIPQYNYYVAELFLKIKDAQGMEVFLSSYLEKNPKDFHAWNFLGYAHLDLDPPQLDKAEKYLTIALEVAPNDPYVIDSYAWLLYHQKRYNESIKMLTKALKKTPHEWEMVKHLALVYKAKGDLEQATKVLSQFAQSAAGRVINKEIESFINSWADVKDTGSDENTTVRSPSGEK